MEARNLHRLVIGSFHMGCSGKKVLFQNISDQFLMEDKQTKFFINSLLKKLRLTAGNKTTVVGLIAKEGYLI